jgi:hypothetical protein
MEHYAEGTLLQSKDIVQAADYIGEIANRFSGLRYDLSSFKAFFARSKKIFFECTDTKDIDGCLKKVLARQDFEEFVIISVIKETDDSGKDNYSIDESRFKRLGKENLEAFINRYQKNLQEPMALSMQLFNKQQMEVIGFSYVSPEDREELMKRL